MFYLAKLYNSGREELIEMNKLAKNSTTAAMLFIFLMIKIEKIINKSKTERFRTSYVPFQGIPKKKGKKKKKL